MSTLYDVLGVAMDADQKTIRKAYHRAALLYHPDKLRDADGDLSMFHKIAEAFTVLSNDSLRESYNKELMATKSSSKPQTVRSREREELINDLERREERAKGRKDLDSYIIDLETHLERLSQAKQWTSFEEYEKFILSAYSVEL